MRGLLLGIATILALASLPSVGRGDEFEREPIHYSKAQPRDTVARLQAKLDSGKLRLAFEKERGYLPSMLEALGVSPSSQTLVFSKTSLQRSKISPKKPRAIYFGDDLYVGYCQGGEVLEISAVDPQLGAVFYTLEQHDVDRPKFVRQIDSCILCHGSSQTKNVPGHLVRSVFADGGGDPILSHGTTRVDQATPFERRWGGWYVTGTHGEQRHLGNLIVRNRQDRDAIASNPRGQNVTSLADFCDTSAYLTPYSDIAALLVLEHQTEAHNLLARASIQTRRALHDQAQLNKELKESPDYVSDSTRRRIKSVVEPLVRYLLFSGEAKLTAPIKGTSTFAADFARRGPCDKKGRSLRELDLQCRLFKYPCSYLIYSDAFTQMPSVAKDLALERMHEVLTDRDYSGGFGHLSAADREAIMEILRETVPDLPAYWRK